VGSGDILYVERKLADEALPKLIEVNDEELTAGLQKHLKETRRPSRTSSRSSRCWARRLARRSASASKGSGGSTTSSPSRRPLG
jgi:hypothetical protein